MDAAGGVVYVADAGNDTIRRIQSDGTVTTLAGLAGALVGSVDGVGPGAGFYETEGVAVGADGVVYVADIDRIRKVQPNGTVTTLAGPSSPGSVDGVGRSARFFGPSSVAVDPQGVAYVADAANSTIRKIQPNGAVTTLAGLARVPGTANGVGSAARFNWPYGLAVDPAGVVYVADTGSHTIRKVQPDGTVTTFAGLAGITGSADGVGSAARFNSPHGVAVDAAGVVYVADTGSHTIRKVQPDGTVTTLAGLVGITGSADGVGSVARFSSPHGVAVDDAGVVYVADYSNGTIRTIQPDGTVSTLAGLAGHLGFADGIGSAAQFAYPAGISVDVDRVVYVSEVDNSTIRRIQRDGTVTTVAGSPPPSYYEPPCPSAADGLGAVARLCDPLGVAVASPGRLVVADTGHNTIRVLTRLHGREFDGDGVTDVSVYRPTTGEWFVRQSLSGPWWVRFGGGSDLPVSGDFDGDGLRDVAVYRPVFGTWFWLKSSTGNKQYAYLGWGVPGQNDRPAPGDYDGDGKADPTVFGPAFGTWFVLQSSTNYHTVMTRGWGVAGDVLVPGDYDGDGRTDIAVYRPSTGQWFVLPSSNGFTAGLPVVTVGDAGDVPVNGDFDGDGKKDIALYRSSNGTWYWAKSSSGNTVFESVGWGMQKYGDMPVPGDYDGDGKADPTVYRPASGTWFILKSSTNYTKFVAYGWGKATDIPLGGER